MGGEPVARFDTRIQGEVRGVDREDEEAWDGCDGSVCLRYIHFEFVRLTTTGCRMAVGLGMTPEEYKELRDQTDDSFWVMRIIGKSWSVFVADVQL